MISPALHCLMCPNLIPEERGRRGALTCGEVCRVAHRKWRADHHGYSIPEASHSGDHLNCLVCGQKIDRGRAQRGAPTCSQRCKDAYRQWRIDRLREQKCPACNHPSTPEEWEDFRHWRKDRYGRLKSWRPRKGNPHWEARAKALHKQIEEALPAIEGALMELDPPEWEGQKVEPLRRLAADKLRTHAAIFRQAVEVELPESDYAKIYPSKEAASAAAAESES